MTPFIRNALIGVFAGTIWAGTIWITAFATLSQCRNPPASLTR